MPKPLRDSPPSSSVARFLDVDAASRAITATSQRMAESQPDTLAIGAPPGEQQSALPFTSRHECMTVERICIKREFILDRSTDETFNRLVELYRRATSTRLSGSHVLRAMMRGVAACLDPLQHEAVKIGRLKLPGTAAGREPERASFEERIAEALVNGMRSAAVYRRSGR